jgi:hypothetical protein
MRYRPRSIQAEMMIAALASLAATAGVAAAAEPATAEELIRRGIELRQQGKETRALPFFQKAYELTPAPRTAAQLGLNEMALGYQLDSERHLAEALSSSHDLWIHKNRAVLEEAIAKVRQAIGEITIRGPDGAEAFVNGKSVGRLPLVKPVRLGEGPSSVELRAQGAVTPRKSVQVMGGKTEEVTLEFPREQTAPPSFVPRDTPRPEEATRPASPTGGGEDRPDQPAGPGKLRLAAWATAVGAAVFVGVGVFETATWLGRKHDFEQHVGPKLDNPADIGLNCGADDPHRGGMGCEELYENIQGPRTMAIVGYGVGAALAVASAVLFWASTPAASEGSQAFSCAPGWSPHGLTAQCHMTF